MNKFKPIIVIFIIVVIIIILDIISNNYTDKSIEDISQKLNTLDFLLEEMNKIDKTANDLSLQEDIENNSKDMVNIWKKRQKILNCYIEHNEIEKISDKIHLIEKQIRIDSLEDARQSITEAEYTLEHLKEKQKLSLVNLF